MYLSARPLEMTPEATPPYPRITAPMNRPAPPVLAEVELPIFGSVENQQQIGKCYVCGHACAEYAVFPELRDKAGVKPSYTMFLHRWCWQRYGGGLEAEKAAGKR